VSLITPRDLFIHELSDTMSAEQIIVKMLPELQKEVRLAEAKKAISEHERETRQQISNLQAVFKQLGEKPEPTTCHAAEGLRKEHDALHEEKPSPAVLEMGVIGGAAKTEHYEIASYTLLVQMAKDLKEPEAAKLLQENLAQEKAMAKRVQAIAKTLGKAAKPTAKSPAKKR
jgi:ferritin-like metal-binding protein YciE